MAKRWHRVGILGMAGLWGSLAGSAVRAQIAYATPGVVYTQTFDDLPSAPTGSDLIWADNATLPGWYALAGSSDSVTGVAQRFRAGTGSNTTGALWSFGIASSRERALGSLASNTYRPIYFGARFVNLTGNLLTRFTLSYRGEQWRSGGGATQTLAFSYSLNATGIAPEIDVNGVSGEYVAFPALDFRSPNNGGSGGALDGNAVSAQVAITANVNGIVWLPNTELWIRWTDVNDAGNDHALAIDDLTFAAGNNPSVSGSVTLEGFTGETEVLVTFVFVPVGSGETFVRTVAREPNGRVLVPDVPPGRYRVGVKSDRNLRRNVAVDTRTGEVTDLDVLLPAGDANNDNFVDTLDLAILIDAFNTAWTDDLFQEAADFNGDRNADALDLALLISNFNTEGEP